MRSPALPPASCLFVGSHWAGKSGPSANLAEYWNGTSWRIATAPPRGALNSELGGLACSDARNCMAVGGYEKRLGHSAPFAARWHNGRWQLLATPSVRAQRDTSFQGISCPTAALCVPAGNTEDNTRGRYFHAFAQVWSGGKWHISTLRRAPSLFIGVSCPARNRCFAAGYTFPSLTTYAHPLIETWNGRTRATQHPVQTAAPRSGDVLLRASCVNMCPASIARTAKQWAGSSRIPRTPRLRWPRNGTVPLDAADHWQPVAPTRRAPVIAEDPGSELTPDLPR